MFSSFPPISFFPLPPLLTTRVTSNFISVGRLNISAWEHPLNYEMTAVSDRKAPPVQTHTHTHHSTHICITLFWFWMDRWLGREKGGRGGGGMGWRWSGGVEIYNLLKRMRPCGIFSKWPLFAPRLGGGWREWARAAAGGVCPCVCVCGGVPTTLPLHTVTWARRGPICQIISCCLAQRFYLQEFHRGRIE